MSGQNYRVDDTPEGVQGQPVYTRRSRRGMRRMERAARRTTLRTARSTGTVGWLGGAVLIGLGLLFMLQNTGVIKGFQNWWALFLLLPAAAALATAVGLYQRHGNWTAATGSLIGSVFFLLLTATFLFGFDTQFLWPFLLIAGGVLILAGPLLPGEDTKSS